MSNYKDNEIKEDAIPEVDWARKVNWGGKPRYFLAGFGKNGESIEITPRFAKAINMANRGQYIMGSLINGRRITVKISQRSL